MARAVAPPEGVSEDLCRQRAAKRSASKRLHHPGPLKAHPARDRAARPAQASGWADSAGVERAKGAVLRLAPYTRMVDPRLRDRALTPRYSVVDAAQLLSRPTQTIRRWSLGNRRRYKGDVVFDQSLIVIDGESGRDGLPLSFLNLLELRMLTHYRTEAALQAIRSALNYAAQQMDVERPLLTVEFQARGGELFAAFERTEEGRELLVSASRGGQLPLLLPKLASEVTTDVDYDREVVGGWWPISRNHPVVVDLRVAAGRPITAKTAVRVDAITSRLHDGWSVEQIVHDTGALEDEVEAARRLELVA